MDEQFEERAQEAADNLEHAANQSWQNLEDAAQQAGQDFQSPAQLDQPQFNQPQQAWQQPPVQQPQYAPNDPNRWTGELYTPEVTPPDQTYSHPRQGGYVDSYQVGQQAPPPPAKQEKDKFPVWAIVLIVLLVLLICIACTILPFALLASWAIKLPL